MTNNLHSWNLSPAAAREVQNELRRKVELTPLSQPIHTIGGADIAYEIGSDVIYAGIVVLSFPEMKLKYANLIQTKVEFPYVPGLLSFREIPALFEAWNGLPQPPDLLVMDGQGIAHPRRFGVASHFGLLADVPTIGCAKKRLIGHAEDPAEKAGSASALLDETTEEQLGWVLRTRDRVKPVWISPGHKIDLAGSLEIMRKCLGPYRIPAPTREGHIWVGKCRSGDLKPGLISFE